MGHMHPENVCFIAVLVVTYVLVLGLYMTAYIPLTRYCVNCGLGLFVGQCQDPFSSRWCRLSSRA